MSDSTSAKPAPAIAVVPAPERRSERASSELPASNAVVEARTALQQQAAALAAMAARLDGGFAAAVSLVLATEGRVVVIGVGKSGIIGRKIAATLSSTGTPSMFVNAAEARHGDLGMVTRADLCILISYSGETDEVVSLLPHLRALRVPMVAIVGGHHSTLARGVDVVLDVSVPGETCPNNLAPTTSTLATLAMGDALAVALMRERNFGAADFRRTHPGGNLGRRLGAKVREVMQRERLPLVAATATLADALRVMTLGQLGLVIVMNGERLVGLLTDGDLRRAMQREGDTGELMARPVTQLMTRNPATIDEDTLVIDALARMQAMKLKALIALGDDGRVSGVIEIFDAAAPAGARSPG
jgi:arabinose-5-phosphate isomerase